MIEYEDEPVRGLPELLPPGEVMLWQGMPDWKALALDAFHLRAVALYFALIAGVGAATGAWIGALVTLAVGTIGVGLLTLLAWLAARSTVYTLTSKRIVLRFGVALPKCVNLPLTCIATAELALGAKGHGNIALRPAAGRSLGWLHLWPHVRPWRMRSPEPMLRAVPDAEPVARLLARQLALIDGGGVRVAPVPVPELAVAA